MENTVQVRGPEVVFIEWRPSVLTWYGNAVTLIEQPQAYWVSAPYDLMDDIEGDRCTVLLWSEELIAREYSSLTLSAFAKSWKLAVLAQAKKPRGHPMIIFGSFERINAAIPVFEEEGLPRSVPTRLYRADSACESKYYLYFDEMKGKGEDGAALNFKCQRIW